MKKIFIIAGEPSGDALGAALLHDLRQKFGTDLIIRGIGGPNMAEQGLASLFPMQDLTLMGLLEVVPRIPLVLKRLNETFHAIAEFQPDAVITIDLPDFSFRLARRLQILRRAGMKLIHYGAPSVWAWRPKRAAKIAKLYDLLLCLFPFEPPYFTREGMAAEFVGHPVMQNALRGNGAGLRARLNIAADRPVLCLLPGSRQGEIARLLPLFLETINLLRQRLDCTVILPTLPHLAAMLQDRLGSIPDVHIVTGTQEKWDAMAAANLALAASGTVTLELVMADCPHVIAYKINPLTHLIARPMIKTPYANLVNIALQKIYVPEFIQTDVVPQAMANCLYNTMTQPALQQQQHHAFALLKQQLAAPQSAADVISGFIARTGYGD